MHASPVADEPYPVGAFAQVEKDVFAFVEIVGVLFLVSFLKLFDSVNHLHFDFLLSCCLPAGVALVFCDSKFLLSVEGWFCSPPRLWLLSGLKVLL